MNNKKTKCRCTGACMLSLNVIISYTPMRSAQFSSRSSRSMSSRAARQADDTHACTLVWMGAVSSSVIPAGLWARRGPPLPYKALQAPSTQCWASLWSHSWVCLACDTGIESCRGASRLWRVQTALKWEFSKDWQPALCLPCGGLSDLTNAKHMGYHGGGRLRARASRLCSSRLPHLCMTDALLQEGYAGTSTIPC